MLGPIVTTGWGEVANSPAALIDEATSQGWTVYNVDYHSGGSGPSATLSGLDDDLRGVLPAGS